MTSESKGFGPGVTKGQLDRLVNNYRKKIKKVRKGGTVPQDHNPKNDTNSVWFSRAAVEELFKVNNADGLRIYFGVHDTAIMPTPYDDQLTVVLVATQKVNGANRDQMYLAEEENKTALEAEEEEGLPPGSGLNHAIICPPNECP